MESIDALRQQVQRKYALQTELLRLTHQTAVLNRQRQEAAGELYHRKAVLQEYESGFFPRWADKSRGTYQDKVDAMVRDIKAAETIARSRDQDYRCLKQKITETEQELASLEGCEERLAQLYPESPERGRWKARFLCGAALPALEESHRALLEYRRMMQGSYPGRIITYEERQTVYATADVWGEKCRELLEALEPLLEAEGIPFQLKGYYASPTAYIISAAADHNRRDRLNKAIDQSLDYQKQLRAIGARLEE